MKTSFKKQIHFIIQGKGGCGKSLLALILGILKSIKRRSARFMTSIRLIPPLLSTKISMLNTFESLRLIISMR